MGCCGGGRRGGGMGQGKQEEAEMEVLLMEIPRAAPLLPQNQRRLLEEPLGEELHGPLLGGDAAAPGLAPLALDGPSLVSAPSMEEEGVCRFGVRGFVALDDWNALGGIGNNPVDSDGIWSRRGDGTLPSILQNPVAFLDQERAMVPQRRLRHDSPMYHLHLDGLCSVPISLLSSDGVWSDLERDSGLVRNPNPCERAVQVADRAEVIEELLASQWKAFDSDDPWGPATPPISPQTVLPNSPSGFSVLAQRKGLSPNGCNLQYLASVMTPGDIDAFTCEDSFIIQGKELQCVAKSNGCGGLEKEWKRSMMGCRLGFTLASVDNLQSPGPRSLPFVLPKYEFLMGNPGFTSLVAKDQQGCRFLQRKFEEGTEQEKEMIFNEIIDHVPELMVDPFGNYLMQKVLDMCTEEQRLGIITVLTQVPNELVKISLNMHGTRAVQKLIEVLQNRKETALVMSALQPGFLRLVLDPNGNHVIQRCLQYFSYEQSKFIFHAAARHCVDIATHRHGCCVLQRCIAHSTGQLQAKLLAEVSRSGLLLAQDAYGNYAVQYILDLKNPSVIENLKSKFKGNYVQLSMQKFSSNVVEKCLHMFDGGGRRMIISELLSVACFDHLMQDPYANYVIQSALLVCKGHLRISLVDAIRPHAVLRANPYCKGIFSLVKKCGTC